LTSSLHAKPELSVGVTPFEFQHAEGRGTAAWYLAPVVESLLPPLGDETRILDVGCGNGYWAGRFIERGCTVVGVDPSESGIAHARRAYGQARFEADVVRRDLLQRLGEEPFDVVVSLEVVEHLYAPRIWAEGCHAALRAGGVLVCSTPYHGYLKNLAISLRGGWDRHWQPQHEGGHIKFWSPATLDRLLTGAGFRNIRVYGAGRWPYLWKSMVLRAERPMTGPS